MNSSTNAISLQNSNSRPRRGFGCWQRLLASGLTLGLTVLVQTARADIVVLDDDFNDPNIRLTVNTNGIGGAFNTFTASTGFARETNSYAQVGNTGNGAGRANIASQNPLDLSAVGTLFDFQNVKYTNTTVGGAPLTDRLIIGVLATNNASDWFESGISSMPRGFYIEPNCDDLAQSTGVGGGNGIKNGGWSSHTSVLFYKGDGTNVYVCTNWSFQTLGWNVGFYTNYSPVLDIKLTLSATGWALNITGDVNTNGQPINYRGTYAAAGIPNNVFLNGIDNAYVGTEGQTEGPCIQESIDRIVVTQLGNLIVPTPKFSTPQYGGNVSTVFAGEAVNIISAVTDSSGTPTLQWQLENLASPGTFTNLPSGNTTNLSLNTSGLGDSLPRGIRLLANDGINSVTSAVVALTVIPASVPVLAQDITPQFLNLYHGQGGTFSASWTGNKPFFYQWQQTLDGNVWTNLPNGTNRTYVIPSAGDGNAGYYQVIASNIVGTTISGLGYVTIIPGDPFILWSAAFPIAGLNAEQILTNFPPANKVAGALIGGTTATTVTLTNAGNEGIVFAARGGTAWANVTGGSGSTTGASTNRTGNTPFDSVLNTKYFDNGLHVVVMSNLVVGQKYQVQLFALDTANSFLLRQFNWQNPADAPDVSATYQMGDNAYLLGTFTATNSVQPLWQNLLGDSTTVGTGNFNCLVLWTVGWNPPPYWLTQPVSRGSFAGVNVSLSGSAAGDTTIPSPTVTYRWASGPAGGPYTNLVEGTKYAGTTTTTLTITNLTDSDGIPGYVLIASNGSGSTTSSVANIFIQATPPAPAPGSFGAYALSNNPVAYWQLAETNNPASGTVLAYDYTGTGHAATYRVLAQNAYNGVLSPQPTNLPGNTIYPGFATNQGALRTTAGQPTSAVTVPALNLNTNAVTICMWINPSANPGTSSGLLFERGGSETAGFGFGGTTSGGMPGLGYTWNNNSATTFNYSSGLYPLLNVWQFVALVVKSNSATFYLYYVDPASGKPQFLSAVHNNTENNQAFNGAGGGTILIGGDLNNANRTFPGSISDVAVYNASLSPQQILQLFGAGLGVQGFAPTIANAGQPQPRIAYLGITSSFSVSGIGGSLPLGGFQWQFNGTNLVDNATYSGSNTNTLTIANVQSNNAGPYTFIVTNSFGSATSIVATLTIVSRPPTNLVGHWLAGTASLADTSGFTPGGIHDGYGVGPAGTNYVFTNDVPPGATGQSLYLYGNTAISVSNSATVDAGYTNTYDNGISNSFTVMVWAKGWPGAWNPWVSKYGETGAPAGGWQVRPNNVGPNTCFTMRGNSPNDDMTSSFGSNDGKWHNYAGTYDAVTGIRTLYVDGKVAATLAGNGPYTLSPVTHLVIGGRDQPAGNNFTGYFTGLIYDVRVYSYPLTQGQIVQVGVLPPPVSTKVIPGANGGQMVLAWPYGTLLEATNIAGPWNVNTNVSPFTNNMRLPADFFKVSNP